LKEISQFFEGNFGQNKEKKRIFWFFKVAALVTLRTWLGTFAHNLTVGNSGTFILSL
jgi:hypothetical protein